MEEREPRVAAEGGANPTRGLHGPELPPSTWGANPVLRVRVGDSIAEVERRLILATLEQLHGDKRSAARILGISLKTLYNRLAVYAAAAAGRPGRAVSSEDAPD